MIKNKCYYKWIRDFISIVLLSGFIGFSIMLLYPFNPLTVTDLLSIDRKEVPRGGSINFQLNAVKHMNIAPEVSIELVNSVRYHIMTYNPHNPTGDKFPTRNIIPYQVHPGKYKLHFVARYPVWMQVITREAYSCWFEVK